MMRQSWIDKTDAVAVVRQCVLATHGGVAYMGELSDRQVQAWIRAEKPIAGKSDRCGLTFTLSAAGTASWVFRYRLHSQSKELTLGNYPNISLKTARNLATKARAAVDQGINVAHPFARHAGVGDDVFRDAEDWCGGGGALCSSRTNTSTCSTTAARRRAPTSPP
jgi:Arm DNA-binding domain